MSDKFQAYRDPEYLEILLKFCEREIKQIESTLDTSIRVEDLQRLKMFKMRRTEVEGKLADLKAGK